MIIVILHTNTDNPLFYSTLTTQLLQWQNKNKGLGKCFGPFRSFEIVPSNKKGNACTCTKKRTNATCAHRCTHACAHTWTHHAPFTLQLRWVSDSLVLTCYSDDSSTATQRCPLSLPAAPSFTLMSRWVDNIITHHITTETQCFSAALYHSHIDMLVIVLYSLYCMRTLFHINTSKTSSMYHFYIHMSTLSQDHCQIDTHYNSTSLSFVTNPMCHRKNLFYQLICVFWI